MTGDGCGGRRPWRLVGQIISITHDIWAPQIFSRWWFQIFFIFIPSWGNDPILTNIFQRGWNHQPVFCSLSPFSLWIIWWFWGFGWLFLDSDWISLWKGLGFLGVPRFESQSTGLRSTNLPVSWPWEVTGGNVLGHNLTEVTVPPLKLLQSLKIDLGGGFK